MTSHWTALNQIEAPILEFIAAQRIPEVTQFVRGYTALGSLAVALAIFGVIASYGILRKREELADYGAKGLFGSLFLGGVVAVLKLGFARPLPEASIHDWAIGFGFPSGHTASAFFVATYLGYRYKRLQPVLIIYAVLVGLSRLYTGAHYPTDVLAGAILGILFAEEIREAKIIKWVRAILE